MGRQVRAAARTAALVIIALGCTEAAWGAGPSTRVIQGEFMSASGGGMVRAAGAFNGRALALRPGGEARRRLTTFDVEAVFVRARAQRCRSAAVTLAGGDLESPTARVGRRWTDRRLELPLPAGTNDLRLAFAGAGSRRCRLLVDRLKLTRSRTPVARPGQPVPPAPPAPRRKLPLGSSVIVKTLLGDGAYSKAVDTHFKSLTPENELKMEWLQPEEGQFNFAAADALVEYATSRGIAVRGHALIFGAQTPPWVGRKAFPEQVDWAMRDHIHAVMRRYAGRIRTWDVVNEAFTDSGRFKYNPFFEKFGSRYVEKAFRYARQADPTARLVYNEINAERDNRRRTATFGLVKSLKEKGLIDAVGFQMHTAIGHAPSQQDLEDTFRLFQSIGVEVEITEMDVSAGDGGPETLPARLAEQAEVFRSAANACAIVLNCTAMTVWGVSDRYSWLGAEDIPLLLDTEFRPKPAYEAVKSVIG